MTTFRFRAAVGIFASLAACSKGTPDRQLACDDIPGLISGSPRATSREQYALIEQCIHKWGFRFALAPGANSEIAKAVVYRCSEAIFDYYKLLGDEKQVLTDTDKQSLDQEFKDMALMRVVQQRAGQCPIGMAKS